MTYKELAKKWRRNARMFKVLHRYHRKTDPNFSKEGKHEWVGSTDM